MNRMSPRTILILCILLSILITAIKIFRPELILFNSGYVFVVMLTIFIREDFYTRFFGYLSIGIILLTMIVMREYYSLSHTFMHLATCGVIFFTILVVIHIKRLYRSIDKEKRYLNALFEYATEGVVLTNKDGLIVLINPAALKLFGYSESELLGKAVEILIPTRFKHNHTQYRESFNEAPANRTMGHGRELFARKKNGSEFPVEVSLSYFRQKSEFFVIAFIVDITQRKESERRLIEQKEELEKVTHTIKKLNAELETKVEERTMILREALHELERSQQDLSEALNKEKELNEIKSRFVSMASHEFRTPLSTVLSSASLISKYKNTDEQDRRDKHIRRIKDSVKHLNDLLEDFLSLGKLEEGKVLVKSEKFSVREFIEDTIDDMRGIFKNGQQVDMEFVGTGSFTTDKKLLKNVLINILSNAVKFSPEDARIELKTIQDNGNLSVSVKDKGIGISEEDQQHLFSSFFRAKNATNIQGTGMGLHIVKRYLELVNGSISLNSRLDEGTTVTIEVPELEEANQVQA